MGANLLCILSYFLILINVMGEMKQKTHKKQEELTYVPSISSFTLCFEEAM